MYAGKRRGGNMVHVAANGSMRALAQHWQQVPIAPMVDDS
jgi:hypothetical protein